MNLDRWLDLGRSLTLKPDAYRWAIGDWFLTGEAHYGDDVYQHISTILEGWIDTSTEVFHQPTLTETTLKQYAWMAETFKEADRHPGQSYTSHRLVAKLSDRSQWLTRSAKLGWTAKTLKEKLVEAGKLAPSTRVKRWSLEELDYLAAKYDADPRFGFSQPAAAFLESFRGEA